MCMLIDLTGCILYYILHSQCNLHFPLRTLLPFHYRRTFHSHHWTQTCRNRLHILHKMFLYRERGRNKILGGRWHSRGFQSLAQRNTQMTFPNNYKECSHYLIMSGIQEDILNISDYQLQAKKRSEKI